jgi:capsular exopolysaccharide synthesis family protein
VVEAEGLRLAVESRGLPDTLLSGVRIAPDVRADTIRLAFTPRGVTATSNGSRASAAYGEPLEVRGVRFTVAGEPEVAEAALRVLPRHEAVERVAQRLRVRPRDGTDVVDVEFTAFDALLAQRVVNAVAHEFVRHNTAAARQQSIRRRRFVEEQLVYTDSLLAEAQRALSEFRTRERVYSSRERFAAQQRGLMGLEVRRQELDADRRMYRRLLEQLRQARQSDSRDELHALVSSPGIAANPVVAQMYRQLVQYEQARDSLAIGRWSRAATNPDVERLNTLIGTTETRIEGAVRSHITEVEARLAALDELQARSAVEMEGLPVTEAEEMRLVEEAETVRGMADHLRQEHQRARIAEAVEAGQVELLDLAHAPGAPLGSRRSLKLALGLILGLMLGAGLAFLVESLNTSIRRREELEGRLGVSGLGVIPRISPAAWNGRKPFLRFRGIRPHRNGAAPRSATLVTATEGRSGGAEAYRTLRTNLLFSQAVRSLRRMVVTSSSAAEGKTTTSANLAITFAQQGMRVLLVDCDLRRPQIHAAFGLPREPGLTQLVLGHADAAEVVRETEIPGLHVLTCGTLPPNPSELLGGERMRAVLETLGLHYDLVMMDTPPLAAAADAAILGRQSDGVLLVVRAGATERGAAEQAVQQLHAVGARIVGAVLNDPDAKVPMYGGYYGYYASYYGEEAGAGV